MIYNQRIWLRGQQQAFGFGPRIGRADDDNRRFGGEQARQSVTKEAMTDQEYVYAHR